MSEKDKKIPNLQKKMNRTLEQYFTKKAKVRQPVGTSVNPLGAFQIKPMVQDFSRPVNYPTPLPQKPFDFKPIFGTDKTKDKQRGDDHPGRDKKSKLTGQAHEGENKFTPIEGDGHLGKMPLPKIETPEKPAGGKAFSIPGGDHEAKPPKPKLQGQAHDPKDKSFGLIGDDHLGKMPTPKIDGEMHPPRDKAFGLKAPEKPEKERAFQIPGDEHKPRDRAFGLEGQAHTPKDKAFGLKGGDHKGAILNTPFGETPSKPTHELNPIEEPVTEHPAVGGTDMSDTPEKSTAEIPPMPETPEKEGFTPNEAWNQPIEFTYADRGTNGHDPSGVLKIHQDQAAKDKKPWEGVAGDGQNYTHLNNNETRFTKVDENVFQFDNKMPAGGTSLATWTRAFYNKGLKLTENDNTNYSIGAGRGGKVPESTLLIMKGDVGDGTEGGLFNKSGKVASRNKDKMYKKVGKNKFVSLRDEAKRNNPRASLWLSSPQVQRGLSKGADNPTTFLEKINDLTAPVIDLVRVSKYLVSPDGLLFMAKQVGLQLSNPKMEFTTDVHANRIFNPLAFALQVPANVLGIHIDRHNLGPLNESSGMMARNYEGVINHEQQNADDVYTHNRLAGLLSDFGLDIAEEFNPSKIPLGGKIDTLSGNNGPHALYGIIGKTNIHRSTYGKGGSAIESSNYSVHLPYAKTYAAPVSDVKEGESDPNFQITIGNDGREDTDADLTKPITNLSDPDKLPSTAAHGFPSNTGPIDPKEEMPGSFLVHDYDTLTNFRAQRKGWKDFRDHEGFKGIYEDSNIIRRLRITDHGVKPGQASDTQDMYGDDPDNDNDFVKIKIVSKEPELTVMARAYNFEVTDKLNPSWTSFAYSGNPAESHVFDKIGRSWEIKFAVPSFSAQELKRNYLRLNNLMRLASPKIVSQYASGNIVELTVGHLWVDQACIIDTFQYNFIGEQWDIAFGDVGEKGSETSKFELPMHYEVTMGGKFLVNYDGGVWNNEGTFLNSDIWSDIMG